MRAQLTALQRDRALERDGYVCRYCGVPADVVGHIVPREVGGTNEHANLVSACRSCWHKHYAQNGAVRNSERFESVSGT